MTVIIVVEVVGVRPRGHTSAGAPVKRHTSAFCANSLRSFPVMTMNCNSGLKRFASVSSSRISRVFPELEMTSITSFSCKMPRSPCWASLGWRNTAGIPVEQKVVAMFMAICPALPMPLVTSLPFLWCTCSMMRAMAFSYGSPRGILRMAVASCCRISCMRSCEVMFSGGLCVKHFHEGTYFWGNLFPFFPIF